MNLEIKGVSSITRRNTINRKTKDAGLKYSILLSPLLAFFTFKLFQMGAEHRLSMSAREPCLSLWTGERESTLTDRRHIRMFLLLLPPCAFTSVLFLCLPLVFLLLLVVVIKHAGKRSEATKNGTSLL